MKENMRGWMRVLTHLSILWLIRILIKVSFLTSPEVTNARFLGVNAYDKPGMGLELLRYDILGEARFDSAFRYYIRSWAYKHPTPWDFFHAMENSSGEDLSWFWRGWFMNNWKIDQAVAGVEYPENN